MSEQKSDEQFFQEVTRELDKSCDSLDAQTLSRLNHIRHQALEGNLSNNPPWYQQPLYSGGALTVCVLVLSTFFYSGMNLNSGSADNEITIAVSELENMEILSAEESFELYEDIEFYQWLSMNDSF